MKKPASQPVSARRTCARRRVFIIDDHPIVRVGLRQLIEHEPDLTVCGEADAVQPALAALRAPLPDLILADVAMPGRSILDFLKDLRTMHPTLPVLVLSTHDEGTYAERLIRAGARGYIMKSEGGARLLEAIRRVLGGEPYLSTAMSTRLFEAFGHRRSLTNGVTMSDLTDREFEVLQLLGDGKTSREVAVQLGVSPKTVEAHRLNLGRKLGAKTAAQLMRLAVLYRQHGTIPR